jgi:hypothetical protein
MATDEEKWLFIDKELTQSRANTEKALSEVGQREHADRMLKYYDTLLAEAASGLETARRTP